MKIHSGQAGYILSGEKINEITREIVRKEKGYPSEKESNIVTEYVQNHISQARLQYSTAMGLNLFPYKADVPDFLVIEPTGGVNSFDIPVEIYLPFNKKELPTDITDRHYARCQLAMLATNKHQCDFMIWMPNKFEIYTLERNEEWLKRSMQQLYKFARHLDNELDNASHLEPIFAQIDDEYLVGLVREYDELKLVMAQASSRQDDILQELAEKVGRDAIIGGKKFTLSSRAGSVSWKKAFDALRAETKSDIDLSKFKGKDSKNWKLG